MNLWITVIAELVAATCLYLAFERACRNLFDGIADRWRKTTGEDTNGTH